MKLKMKLMHGKIKLACGLGKVHERTEWHEVHCKQREERENIITSSTSVMSGTIFSS